MNGGSVAGWAVEDEALIARIGAAVQALGSQAVFDAKYPLAAGRADPWPRATVTTALPRPRPMGAAEADPERRAAGLPPARFCLAEVQPAQPRNSVRAHPPGGVQVQGLTLLAEFKAWCAAHGAAADRPDGEQCLTLVYGAWRRQVRVKNAPAALAVGTVEAFLADYLMLHPAAAVDYIHGEGAVAELSGAETPAFYCRILKSAICSGAWCWGAFCPARPSAWAARRTSVIIWNAGPLYSPGRIFGGLWISAN